jgi:hypothetical protein
MTEETKQTDLHALIAQMEHRLRAVEDRMAIERLFVDLQNATDAHDKVKYSECFTEDGEWSGVTGRAVGRTAIAEHMGRSWQPWESEKHRTYHSVGDITVDLDRETAMAKAQFWHIRLGQNDRPETFHFGRFEADLRKTPEGWRFKRRAGYLILPFCEPNFQLIRYDGVETHT